MFISNVPLKENKRFNRYINNLDKVFSGLKAIDKNGDKLKYLFVQYNADEAFAHNIVYHNPSHYEFKCIFMREYGDCKCYNVLIEIGLLNRIRKVKKKSLQIIVDQSTGNLIAEEKALGQFVLESL